VGTQEKDENPAGGSPADVAMDVEPQPPVAKQQNAAAASTERNGSGIGSALVASEGSWVVSGSCRSIKHECS
jgi:hypothetical protein